MLRVQVLAMPSRFASTSTGTFFGLFRVAGLLNGNLWLRAKHIRFEPDSAAVTSVVLTNRCATKAGSLQVCMHAGWGYSGSTPLS